MARPEGFEPPAPRFVVWCSIQLSYGRAVPATAGARHRGRIWPAQPLAALPIVPRAAQPLRIALAQIEVAQAVARCAKSSANLLCHARAGSVTARCAAIRSSTARRL
jgi:hypothetical protein